MKKILMIIVIMVGICTPLLAQSIHRPAIFQDYKTGIYYRAMGDERDKQMWLTDKEIQEMDKVNAYLKKPLSECPLTYQERVRMQQDMYHFYYNAHHGLTNDAKLRKLFGKEKTR